ncbi:MAG: mucoidy inhibitor MuiA family protein [Deltaproteobacteria bacterium]|nr:mucoidy inhibitor MuiA family protein [Deltaproteobacteria bacterium]
MSEPVVASAPVAAVTVLEDRASVTRRGTIALAAGQHRLEIDRVSPILVDKTLFATATGARVLDVRCERYLAPWRDPESGSASPPATLRAQRVELEAKRDIVAARRSAAGSEATALAEIMEAALRDLAVSAARGISAEAGVAQLAELDRIEAAATVRIVEATHELADLERELARLAHRIQRAEHEAGEQAARIVVDLVAEAGEVTLSLGYVVPGAAWRPYHRAVLDTATSKVEWQTTACIWQATCEDWVDAALTCSLERPSLGVEPPDLADDELRARRRSDQVVVEAREQQHQTTGLGASSGPLEVPGIDDGGLGLTLKAPKATIRADGRPHRVPVGGFSASAQLALVAIPLRSPWVHLRARLVNLGTTPLLAGPVDLVMASGYVGRAEVGFVAAGEKFHLGFGPESDVRLHRDETRERDDAGLLGGWNVQTVRVAIRLSNLGGTKRAIEITERIPLSEVEQVQIEASPPDAFLLDDAPGGEEITQVTARALDDRGMVTWAVELPPFGRRAVTLEYRVKSQRGVAGI